MRRAASQQSQPQPHPSSQPPPEPITNHSSNNTTNHRRRASGTPASAMAAMVTGEEEAGEDGTPRRPTRSKLGPLPRNSPANPLFPPLPPKLSKGPNSSRSGGAGGGGGSSVEGSPVPGGARTVGGRGGTPNMKTEEGIEVDLDENEAGGMTKEEKTGQDRDGTPSPPSSSIGGAVPVGLNIVGAGLRTGSSASNSATASISQFQSQINGKAIENSEQGEVAPSESTKTETEGKAEEEEEEEIDWDAYAKKQREARSFRTSFGAHTGVNNMATSGGVGMVPTGSGTGIEVPGEGNMGIKEEKDEQEGEGDREVGATPSEAPSILESTSSSTGTNTMNQPPPHHNSRSRSGGANNNTTGTGDAKKSTSASRQGGKPESISTANTDDSGNSQSNIKSTRSTRGVVPANTTTGGGTTGRPARKRMTPRREDEDGEFSNGNSSSNTGTGTRVRMGIGMNVDADGDVEMGGTGGEEGAGMNGEEVKADVTRCVCGREDIDVMMISCDMCNVWQHGACVGIWGDEEAPDEYFCEICRPGLHAPLKRFLKLKAKQHPDKFEAPTPEDLKHHHYPSDRIKPSQSKRWADPSVIKATAPVSGALPNLPHRSSSQKAGSSKQSRRDGESPPASATASEFRRGTSRRATTASEKPESARSKVSGSAVKSRRGSTSSDDETPPPVNLHAPPKKRSTMNSRDAAYEAAIQASLAEAKIKGDKGSQKNPSAHSETAEREDEDVDMDGEEGEGRPWASRKRSRAEAEGDEEDDEDRSDGYSSSVDSNGAKRMRPLPPIPGTKPKHPNQYTYRANKHKDKEERQQREREPRDKEHKEAPPAPPAPVSAAPPPPLPPVEKKRVVKTPAESTKKAERVVIREPTPEVPADPTPIGPLNWGLPDHLQPFNHLLPSSHPLPLELINPPVVDRRTGTVKDRDDSYGAGVAPPLIRYEPPTKVKFPGKRMTVGEMRKRVRSVLEYVGRIQVEEVKRGERAKMLGLDDGSGPSSAAGGSSTGADPSPITDDGPDSARPSAEADTANSVAPNSTDPSSQHQPPPLSKSMQLMDDLTRELIKFQEKFESNGSWFAGGVNGNSGAGGDADGMDVDS